MEIIGINQSSKWDEIVKSFPDYDIYYLSGYVKAFVTHGDGTPVLIYYTNENGGRAICVLMIRDIADDMLFNGLLQKGSFFDADTPYGYGGFIFDGKVEAQALTCEFHQVLNEYHVNSVFFRFHPVINNAEYNGMIAKVIPLGKTIALDLASPDIIWENITSKNRNMIRKAEKSGVEIHHGKGMELFETFMEIYNETMRHDNAEEYYFFERAFYESIDTDLRDNYEIFYAVFEGEIIAMSIMLFSGSQMHYHLSGSRYEYRRLAPSNLLLYKAALWGHEQGFRTFHLGGGVGSEEDNLYKFKAAFNRNSDYQFSIGKMIIDSEKYKYLTELRAEVDPNFNRESTYFPVYRS